MTEQVNRVSDPNTEHHHHGRKSIEEILTHSHDENNGATNRWGEHSHRNYLGGCDCQIVQLELPLFGAST